MGIHFCQKDWERVIASHTAWWNGTLDRPLISCVVNNRFEPDRSAPSHGRLSQANCHDFSVSPDDVVEAEDYALSQLEFLGDSFPMMNLNSFGPGVVAAFCGAKLDNSSGGVWFFPDKVRPAGEISIHYNPENQWVRRIKDIFRAAERRWQGNVLVGMPDLGGFLDIVATFVGSEELLYALIDEPEQVRRLCTEAYAAWMDAYRDLSSLLSEFNPAHSDWNSLLSVSPSYIIQSDFSYMISPDMFEEFALPELKRACEDLDTVIYHMDGVGQIRHLDHLLSIPSLKAIQWVPGDGQPKGRCWLDIYRQILRSGRGVQFSGSREEFLDILPEFSRAPYYQTWFDNHDDAVRFLKAAHVPV